jgi:hypothetical protein
LTLPQTRTGLFERAINGGSELLILWVDRAFQWIRLDTDEAVIDMPQAAALFLLCSEL